jgi:DNA-binding winged helix-turn-helix (wHTH) protein
MQAASNFGEISAVTAYEFGPFRFEPAERRLRRDGRLVFLTPKALDTLQALIARAGHAVRKDELMAAVWPRTAVVEATLAQNVLALRKVLGRDSIQTVPKFGYRFALPIRALIDAPSHSLRWGARQFPLVSGENVIGRDPRVAVTLDATTISRRHARITVTGLDTMLEDFGSKNGTFARGVRLTGPAPLADGDFVGFGSLTLTFHDRPPLMTTETQPPPRKKR